MSRIGKQCIIIPEKVTVKLHGQKIDVTGPKGTLSRILPSLVSCEIGKGEDNQKFILVKQRLHPHPNCLLLASSHKTVIHSPHNSRLAARGAGQVAVPFFGRLS